MLVAIDTFIAYVLQIYLYILIARILISWLPNVAESAIGQFLYQITEPYLAPFRKIIPPIGGMLDISPILAIFAYHFLSDFLRRGIITVLSWLL